MAIKASLFDDQEILDSCQDWNQDVQSSRRVLGKPNTSDNIGSPIRTWQIVVYWSPRTFRLIDKSTSPDETKERVADRLVVINGVGILTNPWMILDVRCHCAGPWT